MSAGASGGRANQLLRTRQDLLNAAARFAREGAQPTLEQVAQAAKVSRATAYRHFPDVSTLLVEASFDIDTPRMADVFHGAPATEPVARMEHVDAALEHMIRTNEVGVRLMLKQTLDAATVGRRGADLPRRQNRRTPLIEAALQPARRELRPSAIKTLTRALALVTGTESMLVLKDVLRLDDAEARRVRRWAIRALIDAARRPGRTY